MALDADDIKKVGEIVAEALKTSGDESAKARKAEFAKVMKDIDAKIAKAKPAEEVEDEPEEVEDETAEKPGKKTPPVRESAADKKMASEMAKLRKQFDDEKEARTKAEEANRTARLLAAAKDALTAGGVAKTKAALAILHDSEKRLRMTEDGLPGVYFKRDGYEEVVPMEEGISEWLESDDGLGVLPPKGTQGTGGGNSGNSKTPRNAKGETDWGELKGRVNIDALPQG